MTRSQFETVLCAHKVWLRSSGREGKRADFSFMDLRGAPLDDIDLTRVIMIGTNLQGATLNNTLLRGAFMPFTNLAGASMNNTDFTHARLMSANLRNADLRTSKLVGADLQGALTEGARLPDNSANARLNMIAIEIIVIRR